MFNFLKKKKVIEKNSDSRTDASISYPRRENADEVLERIFDFNFQQPLPKFVRENYAMDDVGSNNFPAIARLPLSLIGNTNCFSFFGDFGFIGYTACALLSQHWLILKACIAPAKDAVRKGFTLVKNDALELPVEIYAEIEKLDKVYGLKKNLIEFVHLGRIFGIRIAIFVVDSNDPDFYEKPFNIDGVTSGSYMGVSMIDPYWIAPELSMRASSDPFSIDFYEPTYWQINGRRIHRSHTVIFRTEQLPDILKPTYFYGGIPVPQKIMRRVFAAERTADEAPHLALSKRTSVLKTDLKAALAKPLQFQERMRFFTTLRDNDGVKVIGDDDEYSQFDTSLSEVSDVTMVEYQLVAAASNIPVTKLLGTVPKGFNATGEFDESSYHEELESIQENDFTPFVDRHHLLLIKSEIAPKFGIAPFEISHVWKKLDSMTAKESAEVQKINADTGKVLAETGAIDGMDERKRVSTDADSGYNGLEIDEDVDSDLDDVDEDEKESEIIEENE